MAGGYSVSDTSSKTTTQGDQQFGGISGGGDGSNLSPGFMSQFWAANPGAGASSFVQGLASIPTWGWIAGGAAVIVLGVILIKRS